MTRYGRTFLLLAAITGLFLAIGYLIGGGGGMVIAFGIAMATNAFAYWNSDRMVLSMYGAHEVDARTAPEYYGIVAQLAQRAGLPMPRVYVIESEQPNAFATGRNPENAAVAASTGLLAGMSREEIAGVMAHELAHVRNRDTLIMTITATLAGAIGMLGSMAMFMGPRRDENGNGGGLGMIGGLLVMILAPIGAALVQMAISRNREYEADRIGGEICGNPLWLASALGRLETLSHQTYNAEAERNPATAHMFIINPLNGQGADHLFSTHPNTANRIAALYEQARAQGSATQQYQRPAAPAAGPSARPGDWRNAGGGSAPRRRTPWG